MSHENTAEPAITAEQVERAVLATRWPNGDRIDYLTLRVARMIAEQVVREVSHESTAEPQVMIGRYSGHVYDCGDFARVTITAAAVEQAASKERVASLAADAGCDPVWLVEQVLTALRIEVTR